MKRAHKNILGLSGLGLVAAVTTIAATMPAPMAGAVASVTDTIKVTVIEDYPSVTLTTGSEPEITSPEYNFSLSYTDLSHVKVTLVNYDSEGGIIYSEILMDEDLDTKPGSRDFNLNLDNCGGHGRFVITATGNLEGVNVEDILSVIYKSESGSDDGGDKEPGDNGDVNIETEIPLAEVKTVTANIYSESGLLLKSFTLTDPAQTETLDLSDLPDGVYILETISRDINGNVIGKETRIIVLDRGGGTGGIDTPINDPGEEIGKVVVTVTDEDGTVVYTNTVDHPNPGDEVHIDTDGFDPGNYKITKDYYNTEGDLIKTETENFTKSNTNGEVDPPFRQQIDVVTTLEVDIYDDATGKLARVVKADRATGIAYIYDASGNLLFSIPNGYRENMRKGDLVIPMEGLESGDYTAVLMYKDEDGRIVGNTITYKIHYEAGKAVIVPDTGGFFQGLNISREDYLITGAVVFAVIGVVAFGVVARNRNNKKTSKRNKR